MESPTKSEFLEWRVAQLEKDKLGVEVQSERYVADLTQQLEEARTVGKSLSTECCKLRGDLQKANDYITFLENQCEKSEQEKREVERRIQTAGPRRVSTITAGRGDEIHGCPSTAPHPNLADKLERAELQVQRLLAQNARLEEGEAELRQGLQEAGTRITRLEKVNSELRRDNPHPEAPPVQGWNRARPVQFRDRSSQTSRPSSPRDTRTAAVELAESPPASTDVVVPGTSTASSPDERESIGRCSETTTGAQARVQGDEGEEEGETGEGGAEGDEEEEQEEGDERQEEAEEEGEEEGEEEEAEQEERSELHQGVPEHAATDQDARLEGYLYQLRDAAHASKLIATEVSRFAPPPQELPGHPLPAGVPDFPERQGQFVPLYPDLGPRARPPRTTPLSDDGIPLLSAQNGPAVRLATPRAPVIAVWRETMFDQRESRQRRARNSLHLERPPLLDVRPDQRTPPGKLDQNAPSVATGVEPQARPPGADNDHPEDDNRVSSCAEGSHAPAEGTDCRCLASLVLPPLCRAVLAIVGEED